MNPINEHVVSVLTRIRQQMHAYIESAWGPEAAGMSDVAANAEAGTLGAENPPNLNDAVNMYLDEIVQALVTGYDFDEDDAVEFIFTCAEDLSTLGAIPDEDAPDIEMSEWLGRAASVGFSGYVCGRAHESE